MKRLSANMSSDLRVLLMRLKGTKQQTGEKASCSGSDKCVPNIRISTVTKGSLTRIGLMYQILKRREYKGCGSSGCT